MIKTTNKNIKKILLKKELTKEDIIILLSSDIEGRNILYRKSAEIKDKYVGRTSYYRGLIEFSNICSKNCYYCGIRRDNKFPVRYELDDETILSAVKFAFENKFASIVLQSGERNNNLFTKRIENLLKKINKLTNSQLGITLSSGEQSEEIFRSWRDAGAHRYLLRIETSNKDLYYKIHSNDDKHNFEKRLKALENLQKIGYQTGTGIMIGLPFQDYEHLSDDLLFFKNFDIDMVGMGPYIEHAETPLFRFNKMLMPAKERFNLTLKMIAILRIMMKDINIAAATALQAIDPIGREKAIKIGANIIMPNITPSENRKNYRLYENKPCIDESAEDCTNCLEARINIAGDNIGYGKRGDSKHYFNRIAL